jgi:hypothetical protein
MVQCCRLYFSLCLLGLLATLLPAQANEAPQTVMVVIGAPGTPEYETQFQQWADLWQQACVAGGAHYVSIGTSAQGPLAGDDNDLEDYDRLQSLLTDPNVTEGNSALWLVLIGHGTFDGRTAKFNLRGPDVSDSDLAQWLESMSRPLAVINTTSCSSPFLQALSGADRVIITATKSGFETNFTHLGGALARTIADPESDLDKDGQTSLLEAYLTAADRVNDFYTGEGRLKTEHALLDDNADGLGTPADWFRGIRPTQRAADGAALDGYRAHQFHLVYNESENQLSPDLRAKRDQLELQVMQLRDNRDQYEESGYYQRLEALLIDLAHIYEEQPLKEERDTADTGSSAVR